MEGQVREESWRAAKQGGRTATWPVQDKGLEPDFTGLVCYNKNLNSTLQALTELSC